MGYAYGASNFTYGYLTDPVSTFYLEFTARSNTFTPGFFVHPSVTGSNIQLKIAQILHITRFGY